jgi:Spy/CpxP family protein refolding chaperone
MNRKIALLASALLLSASLFAMGGNSEFKGEKSTQSECRERGNRGEKGERFKHKFDKLSEEQKKEVEKVFKKYSADKNKVKIEIREKEIVVDKLMLDDKIDWAKVEKAVTDVSASRAKIRVIKLKERKEISQITGEEFSCGMEKREHRHRK